MRLPNINTRFALPIICPFTGETISAETLYNRVCDAEGYQITDLIGDLVFDNLDYSADETVCGNDDSNAALHNSIYAWMDSVREQLNAPKNMTPIQAANEYFRLEAISVSKAIAFAHSYEDTASAEDYDSYLEALDVIAR